MVDEYYVWAVLSIIISLSCMKMNCKAFVTVVCFTLTIGYMMEDAPSSGSHVRKAPDGAQVSAREGEMQPNRRLQERPDSPEKVNHGQESFRHLVKPEAKSQDSTFQAFIKDAVHNGFRL
jgi:hypothetical protein